MSLSPHSASPETADPNGELPRINGCLGDSVRATEPPLKEVLTTAIQSTKQKLQTHTTTAGRADRARESAHGLAIEINRRLSRSHTPASIYLCQGTVDPVSGLKDELQETPLVQAGEVDIPQWATESRNHWWVEVEIVGEAGVLVDVQTPSQVTGRSATPPRIYPLGASSNSLPAEYNRENATRTRLENASITEADLPWPRTATTWPFGHPADATPIPADGGHDYLSGNSIHLVDAMEGLRQLPTGSVDVIITSPPYRLLRTNGEETETIWDADPECNHEWETQEYYTDTPIRESGDAGFRSETTDRSERVRESQHCVNCDGWRGELGQEPTVDLYIKHLADLFEECLRVLSDSGNLFVNIGDSYAPQQSQINGDTRTPLRDGPHRKSLVGVPERLMVELLERDIMVREKLLWVKPDAAPEGKAEKSRSRRVHEHIFRVVNSEGYYDSGGDGDTNILEIETASGVSGPTAPFPEELPEVLLDRAAPEDGVVLDPFAGTGTTLEAAATRGLDYIGFEPNPSAFEIAENRLKTYERQEKSLTGQSELTVF
jgi:site-specific DNA-methyltransferase (cytosine-N4-specific)